MFRPHIEVFHFTDASAQLPDCHTSTRFATVDCQEKKAFRRRVSAWELRQFLLEALEAQIHAEGCLVLAKEASNRFHVFRLLRMDDLQGRWPVPFHT